PRKACPRRGAALGSGRNRAARPDAGRRLSHHRSRNCGDPPDGGTPQRARFRGRLWPGGGAGTRSSRRADGHLLGGRRIRRADSHAFLADGPPRLHGRRPDGRREVDLPAGRNIRGPFRNDLRAAPLRRRSRRQHSRRVVAAVTAAGGTISLLVGAVLLRLTVTDTYRRYVRPEMGFWLAIAGIAVIALGLVTLLWSL